MATMLQRRVRAPVLPLTNTGEATADPSYRRGAVAILLLAVALRLVDLGRGLSFDEAFTGVHARRGFGVLEVLREHDTHPPLDYLIRWPLAQADSNILLRLPSMLFGVAAVAVVMALLRRHPGLSLTAGAIMAIAPFHLLYSRTARMYAILVLLGACAAFVSDRWLRNPSSFHAYLAGLIAFLAMISHTSGGALGFGLLLIAGTKLDREAWRWRLSLAAGAFLWAAIWLPSFIEQLGVGGPSWIEYSSVASVGRALRGLIAFNGQSWLAVAVIVAGTVALSKLDRTILRVWLSIGVVPSAMIIVAGLWFRVVIERTFAFAAWGVVVAIAALIVASTRRWKYLGLIVSVGIFAMTAPSIVTAVRYHYEAEPLVEALRDEDPQLIGVTPDWFDPYVRWELGLQEGRSSGTVRLDSMELTVLDDLAGKPVAEFSGDQAELWIVGPVTYPIESSGRRRCGDLLVDDFAARCVVVTAEDLATLSGPIRP